jgi:hypothetical protein
LISRIDLFGFGLRLELLDLAPLLLDLLLLRLNLGLCLSVGILLILHCIADDEARACTECTTDRSTRSRCTDRGADYGTGARTNQCTNTSAFFACTERLAGASGKRHEHHKSD